MRNLEPEYHAFIDDPQPIVARLLAKAQAKFPKQTLTYCGRETRWQDCLTGMLNGTGDLMLLLYYNVGNYSYAETMTLTLTKLAKTL